MNRLKKEDINLNWNNDGRGIGTAKEKEEVQKYWEENKNISYHYPVRSGGGKQV